jgi:hypothetical protein
MSARCGFFSLGRPLDQPFGRTDALTVTMVRVCPSLVVVMGSMVEGTTMGPGGAGGRITVVSETWPEKGACSDLRSATLMNLAGLAAFKSRGLGSLRGPDMGMYSESMTRSTGSGISRLSGQRHPRRGGGGL